MAVRDRAAEVHAIPPSRNACPTTDEIRGDSQREIADLSGDIEAAIIAVLTRPLAPDETHFVAAARREHELRVIFDQLTAAQALALGKRLDVDRDSDRVAVAFRRVTVERRERLRAYLADTRRRIALASTALREQDGRHQADRT